MLSRRGQLTPSATERLIGDVRAMSAYPSTSDIALRRGKRRCGPATDSCTAAKLTFRSPTRRIAISSGKSSTRPYSATVMCRNARNSRLWTATSLGSPGTRFVTQCESPAGEAYQADALEKSDAKCDAYFGILYGITDGLSKRARQLHLNTRDAGERIYTCRRLHL